MIYKCLLLKYKKMKETLPNSTSSNAGKIKVTSFNKINLTQTIMLQHNTLLNINLLLDITYIRRTHSLFLFCPH